MNKTSASVPAGASETTTLSELDIAVHNLDGQTNEQEATSALRSLPGIGAVRIIERGIWLQYRPDNITADEIIHALKSAGFDARLFQDSASGQTGSVKY